MNTTPQQNAKVNAPPIHPDTRLGHVHYTVSNLDRQIKFYKDILGFKLHWHEGDSAGLGAGGEDLLRLTEKSGAQRVTGTTGLYHTAFLVPTRWELAQLLKRIAETSTPIQGMTNHGTHYAIYLPDAEGNGIELAWDFPSEVWPRNAQEMFSRNRGLSPQEVFNHLKDNPDPWEELDPRTRVGHVHLHVSHLSPTQEFYHRVLGFGKTFELGDSALFFAIGDYHHHIGTNIWQGRGAPQPPADAVGLRYFTVIVPSEPQLNVLADQLKQAGIPFQQIDSGLQVQDPSQNGVLFTLHA